MTPCLTDCAMLCRTLRSPPERATVVLRATALLGLLFLASAGASAQPRFEAWGGVTFGVTDVESQLTSSYQPVIERYSPPLAGSIAGQTVRFAGANAKGIGAGLDVFFTSHLGLQALFETDQFDLSGASGDYDVLLNYTARQPPDYDERSYSSSATFTACGVTQTWGCVSPTSGSLRQTSLGFNLVGRWPAGRRLNLELSGGLSYIDLRGDAQPLRYTVFETGGHSTLFSEQYQLAYSFGPAHAVGVNAGATIDIALGRFVALTADARVIRGGDVSAPVTITGVVNEAEVIFLQDPATIQQTLHPPDVSFSPSRARLLLGLKIRR